MFGHHSFFIEITHLHVRDIHWLDHDNKTRIVCISVDFANDEGIYTFTKRLIETRWLNNRESDLSTREIQQGKSKR